MKQLLLRRPSTLLAFLALSFALVPAAQAASLTTLTVTIDPKLTYLETFADANAGNTIAIDLVAAGFQPGDTLMLDRLGSFAPHGTGAADDTSGGMRGVFSTSNILLSSSTLHRVAGAIDAGTDVSTQVVSPTGGLVSNDIAEDFSIYHTLVTVPTGARYLFVAASDIYWGDNTDPNGDFQVRISTVATAVPEPTDATLFAAGLAALGLAGWRRRRTA